MRAKQKSREKAVSLGVVPMQRVRTLNSTIDGKQFVSTELNKYAEKQKGVYAQCGIHSPKYNTIEESSTNRSNTAASSSVWGNVSAAAHRNDSNKFD